MNLTLPDLLSVAGFVSIIQVLASKWLESRLTQSIKHEYDRKLEEYRFEMRRRDQAARVAKLLALSYQPGLPAHEFNELAWELSVWLPADIVRELSPTSRIRPRKKFFGSPNPSNCWGILHLDPAKRL
jgi:hypothetical protein